MAAVDNEEGTAELFDGLRVPLRYGSLGSRGNAGGGTRRFDADWYAVAAFSATCSMPGSTRKLIENGMPGAGTSVGVVPVRLR